MSRKGSPSIKRVFTKVLMEKKPVSVAMREEGYSVATSRNPSNVTRSETWQELMDTLGLKDEDLLRRHKQLLDSEDDSVAIRALDIGYKVKGKYTTNSGLQFNAPVQINIGKLPTKPQPTDKK